MSEALSKEVILDALGRLNDALKSRDARGELCLFGGAVMVLAFQARPSTQDVDAIFRPTAEFRQAAEEVRQAKGLPENWLNDGVKGWVSEHGETTDAGLPQFSHLHLTMPTASYLLAMKALAARAAGPEGSGDRADIVTLIRHLGLTEPGAVFAIIERYYPSQRVLPKTEYLIREIFDVRQTS